MGDLRDDGCRNADLRLALRGARAQRDEARSRIAHALVLHSVDVNSNQCVTCEAEAPCDTARALGGER